MFFQDYTDEVQQFRKMYIGVRMMTHEKQFISHYTSLFLKVWMETRYSFTVLKNFLKKTLY